MKDILQVGLSFKTLNLCQRKDCSYRLYMVSEKNQFYAKAKIYFDDSKLSEIQSTLSKN